MLIVTRENKVGNPSAIEGQSDNILNGTRYLKNLVPKLRRENEVKWEVALIGKENKVPC